ncbi:MAG: nitrite/sulfite reductase [Magnetococcales bacterium]|nr:nitrite/sulfite reductase [Magnetococcales bacterium]
MNDRNKIAVLEEIDRFGQALTLYEQGRISEDRFLAMRMSLGIYSQRRKGEYMLRLKLPGGVIRPRELIRLADIIGGAPIARSVHLTTRQDIQLKGIPAAQLVHLLRQIHWAGLITREAGGPTVRNIAACPLAGVCPQECRDPLPVVERLKERYLGNPLTRFLPRKFKIVVSGCDRECSQNRFHDLGIAALRNPEGARGFQVTMGGGLGHKPRKAELLEPWVEETALLQVVDGVLRLHHRHSDREKKSRARVKFLWERFGEEKVRELYREELAMGVRMGLEPEPLPGGWSEPLAGVGWHGQVPRAPVQQKQPGLWTVPVQVPMGDLDHETLRGVGELAEELGIAELRLTTDMNLLLLNVPEASLAELPKRLGALGLGLPLPGDDVKACVGSEVCNLGLTTSPRLAGQLSGGPWDLKIRISGCQNGCVHSDLADLGLIGEVRRPHGTPLPCYRMVVGGRGVGDGAPGRVVASIPAPRVPRAVAVVQQQFLASGLSGSEFSNWALTLTEPEWRAMLGGIEEVTPEEAALISAEEVAANGFNMQTGQNECAGSRKANIEMAFARAAHERECANALLRQNGQADVLFRTRQILTGVGATLIPVKGLPIAVSELGLEQVSFNVSRRPALMTGLGDLLLELSTQQRQLECNPGESQELESFWIEVNGWLKEMAKLWMNEDPSLYLRPYLDGTEETTVIPMRAVAG